MKLLACLASRPLDRGDPLGLQPGRRLTWIRGGVDETRGEVIRRRLRTVPLMLLGTLLVTALLPLLVLLALLVDVVRFATRRDPFMTVRMVGVLWVYLIGETRRDHDLRPRLALAWGPRRRQWLESSTWYVQQGWAGSIIAATRLLLGLSVHVEGDDVVEPGP